MYLTCRWLGLCLNMQHWFGPISAGPITSLVSTNSVSWSCIYQPHSKILELRQQPSPIILRAKEACHGQGLLEMIKYLYLEIISLLSAPWLVLKCSYVLLLVTLWADLYTSIQFEQLYQCGCCCMCGCIQCLFGLAIASSTLVLLLLQASIIITGCMVYCIPWPSFKG